MSSTSHYLIDELDRQWEQGRSPCVEDLLAASDPLSVKSLTQLLLVDQSRRWSTGDRVSARDYFDRFPNLLSCDQSAIDLLFAEFLLRESAEPNISIDEFIRHYPQFESEFRRQIDFHRTVGTELIDVPYAMGDRLDVDGPYQQNDIPGYELLGEIGRGGLGVVYLARNLQLNRNVALKMLIAGKFASSSVSKRLLLEAEAIARLQHPNIVQIYDVGQVDECTYLALEYISGGTLAKWMERRPQPPRDAAKIIREIAQTIQFAHENGVIHRDLKPSNLLIQAIPTSRAFTGDNDLAGSSVQPGPEGRLPLSDIRIKIADFGLAKFVQQDSSTSFPSTLSGDLMGTAAYMSPEQASGGSANLTIATDIYSLGAILYELLTGRPPFVGVNPLEVVGQVVSEEPMRPSQLVRYVPRDLQTICLKCLEKNPARRYLTADALADDLKRFLSEQPIVARPASGVERIWRWCRRKPTETTLAASILLILMMIALLSSVYSIMLGNQLEISTRSERTEKALKLEAIEQLWESTLSQADAIRTGRQVGQRFDSLKAIDAARELGKSIPFKPSQIDRLRNGTVASLALSDIRTERQVKRLWPKTAWPSFDSDHSICAYLDAGNIAIVQRMVDGEEIARIETESDQSRLILSTDGQKLAIVDKRCQVYELNKSRTETIFDSAASGPWAFSGDGNHLIGLDGEGILNLVDLRTQQSIKKIGAFRGLRQIDMSPDMQRAAMLIDQSIQVVELDSGKVSLHAAPPAANSYQSFAWHPDSHVLAIGIYAHGIELWDVVKRDKLITLPITGPSWFQFDLKGTRLLSYNVWSQRLELWDVLRGSSEFSRSGDQFRTLVANRNGGFKLLQESENQYASIVEVLCPTIYQMLPAMRSETSKYTFVDMCYSLDGRFVAYYARGEVEIFDSQQFRSLSKATTPFCNLRFSKDKSLFTLNEYGVGKDVATQLGLFRWKFAESKDLKKFQFGPPEAVGDADSSLALARFEISSDGKLVALCRDDGIKIVSTETGKIVQSQESHPDVRSVSIDVNSNRVASAGWNGGKACIWSIETGHLIHSIPDTEIGRVEFSPDGSLLATVASQITVWDTKSWTPACEFKVPGNSSSGVTTCFSPDGRILAVSDSLGRIHLVHPRTGHEFLLITDPDEILTEQLLFSPDGTRLAALLASNPPRIWNLAAIQTELNARNLGWPSEGSIGDFFPQSTQYDGDGYSIGSQVEIILDRQFEQLEASYHVEQATYAAADHQYDSASTFIARALALEPEDPRTCNNLAWLLATGPIQLRNVDKAIELAQIAIQAGKPNSTMYANTLGVALYRGRRYQEAFKVLQQSLAAQPLEHQVYDLYFLSMCSAELGDHSAAIDYFEGAGSLRTQYQSRFRFNQQKELDEFAKEAESLIQATAENTQ